MTKDWYQTKFVERWGLRITLVALLIIGPGVVGEAVEDPSTWHIAIAIVWLAVVLVQTALVIRDRLRGSGGSSARRERLDPATVPIHEIRSAVAGTSSRVAAVKVLRERHPGLGLKDAGDLIDSSAQDPGSS